MGLRLWKSFRLSPVRLNLSTRGLGASWGIPGLRYGISADGRHYILVGFPGSGFYFMHYIKKQKKV
jgi:hypothetical protein